jgi:hypothetical protein
MANVNKSWASKNLPKFHDYKLFKNVRSHFWPNLIPIFPSFKMNGFELVTTTHYGFFD